MNADENKPLISKEEQLQKDTQNTLALSEKIKSFYDLPEGSSWREITQDILNSEFITETQKNRIIENGRKLFVFSYPSDGLNVRGIISFVPEAENPSTMIFLRGGNRLFGLLNPGGNIFNVGTDTVISTCLRGGISEGTDEFGGDDVNDVNNLIEFIPEMQKQLNFPISQEQMYMIGGSRGGLEMFLTLARFPELQHKFKKVVSLSGLVDLRQTILHRKDMKDMFISDFSLREGDNEEDWINFRDPINTVEKIRKDLPILIIQGTDDIRVSLEEGYHMVETLQKNGNDVTYLEIQGADHCLFNKVDRMELIYDWLKTN